MRAGYTIYLLDNVIPKATRAGQIDHDSEERMAGISPAEL